jgi:hypothetical protein
MEIDCRFSADQEGALAKAVLAAPAPVLISWHHSHIHGLVEAIAGGLEGCPRAWPEHRFDVVWVLDRDDAGEWTFSQVTQRFFAHDAAEPI